MPRSLLQVPFEEELNLSLFQTYKVSLDRLEDNLYTLIRQGFSINELEELPYWRYETVIEKTIQWYEVLKEAKEKRSNPNQNVGKILEFNKNTNPEKWTIS